MEKIYPKHSLGVIELNKSTLFLSSILIFGIYHAEVCGKTDVPPSFEEFFTEGGYKTVEDALDNFEQHYKQKPNLPLRVSPISFTHQFGIFHDLDGDFNDFFEVKYINDQIPENHYKIYVRSKKYKIEFDDKYVLKVYKLNNGNDALYMEPNFPFKMLAFENGNWQYVLHIDNRVDEVTPEILVQIANSINYDTEN